MASQVEQWNQFVARLTELTRAGEIAWRPAMRQTSPYGDLVGTAYQTDIEGKLVGIHEYSSRSYNPEPESNHWPDFMVENSVALGVLDHEGKLEWRAPVDATELLDRIRYQASGAGSLLKAFLQKKSA